MRGKVLAGMALVLMAACSRGETTTAPSPTATTINDSATRFARPCADKEVRPTKVALACGDNGIRAADLVWVSYSSTKAVAKGAYVENDCRPTCLGGHLRRLDNALFTFSGARNGVFTEYDVSFSERAGRASHHGYL